MLTMLASLLIVTKFVSTLQHHYVHVYHGRREVKPGAVML